MSSSCMGKELPKEKQFGVKVCRERKCPELQRDPKWPDSPERCMVFNQMPGTLPCCIKDPEMKPEVFLKCVGYHLHEKWEHNNLDIKNPGPKNCPDKCPYKLSETGEVFRKDSKGEYGKRPGKITRCAFTGEVLGGGGGSCMCHVLGNPDQEGHIDTLKCVINAGFANNTCWYGTCPDGIERCKPGDEICPVNRLPRMQNGCPLWRIPAKLLPAPANSGPVELQQEKPANAIPEKVVEEKSAPEKKTRKKKESEDPICKACRERYKDPIEDYQCTWCKEQQEKHGRRGWTTTLQMGEVHLGDMNDLGKQIPADSIDLIFTDPAYVKDQYQEAYANLAELALRVLKPNGFLITYAPQTHLDEIMDMLRYTGTWLYGGKLQYFWIIESLNEGQSTAKNHQRNAICLHKPILVFQKAHEDEPLKGVRRCFADVVRGRRQKKFHPWQQSIHDVIGIISRFMDPGEILLDPYAGTGTTLKAANLLGMDWIGFEIDPKTHAIAVRELQQQPMDLQAFGIEAPAAECEREPVPEGKDTSKQASIEICKVVKTRKESPDDPSPGAPAVELHAACLDCEVRGNCKTHDPKAGCADAVVMEIRKPFIQHCCGTCGHHKGRKTFHDSCPRLGELLFKGGAKSAKVLMEETQRENCEEWLSKAERIPNITWCSTIRNCPALDWEGGICTTTGKKLTEQTYCPTQHLIAGSKPAEKPLPHEEKFNESAEANVKAMGLRKDSPQWFAALTTSKRRSCPAWFWEVWKIDPKKKGEWLYEGGRTEKEADETKKRLESDEFHKGSRFEVRKRPDLCQEQNSMGGCMNGGWSCHNNTPEQRKAVGCFVPIKPQGEKKKPAKKPKPYTIYIKKSDGAHPLIVSCDAQGHGGTSNPCDTREEVVKRALVTLDVFVHNAKKSTLSKKPLPVTIETTLFIDKTGMFSTADFFDEKGEPRKPEPKKSASKKSKTKEETP